jgi:hypothetical protein
MRRLIIVLLVVSGVASFLWFLARTENAELRIGDLDIHARVLRTAAQQADGLSGVSSLPAGDGALFVRQDPDRPPFWMKDMDISIDIIWISPDGSVLDTVREVGPETYPTMFTPPASVGWVLEVAAGTAARYRIGPGTPVSGLPER